MLFRSDQVQNATPVVTTPNTVDTAKIDALEAVANRAHAYALQGLDATRSLETAVQNIGTEVMASRLALDKLANAKANSVIDDAKVASDVASAIAKAFAPFKQAVIDAGALTALAGSPAWWEPSIRPCVLTPHPGEMQRLTGRSVAEILNWQYLAAYALVTLVVVFGGLFWTRRVQGKPLALSSIVTMGMACANSGFVGYPVMMLTLGDGVDMFVLDPSIGAFVRVAERIRMPARNKVYSLNEGNRLSLPAGYQRYLQWAQSNGYSSRYVGAMVGDVHRVLLQGGVFMYPPTQKAPKGKLRLMYEANPMAMLVEQAGGKALAAPGQRILDVQPEGIHQRTCVVLGSPEEVDQVMAQVKGEVASSEG